MVGGEKERKNERQKKERKHGIKGKKERGKRVILTGINSWFHLDKRHRNF